MTEYLLSVEGLAQILDDDDVRVVDLRWSLDDDDAGRELHAGGHIPGAVHLDWIQDWANPDDPVQGQLATPAQFERAMAAAGIGDDTLVVAYDDNELFTAPRLLWAMHHYGHDQVRVLDGGLPAWVAAGQPLATGSPAVPPGSFHVTADRQLRLTKDDVKGVVTEESRDAVILDCRMDRTWEESGAHIPGARRLPSPSLVDPDTGLARSSDEIRAMVADVDAGTDDEIILYCGGGVSASAGYLALLRAGFTNMKVYDGSWSEWSGADDVPIERH